MSNNNSKNHNQIPNRNEVPPEHCWNLDKLYPNDKAWEDDFQTVENTSKEILSYKGTLAKDITSFKNCLIFMDQLDQRLERLSYYALLKTTVDGTNSEYQGKASRINQLTSNISALCSFFVPELMSIPDEKIQSFLQDDELEQFRIKVNVILRNKPHTLSEKEERILAMQSDFADTPEKAYSALANIDIDFGKINTAEGQRPLTQSNVASFLLDPDRNIRKQAYFGLLTGFEKHQNTIANLYNGSVKQDIFYARIRNHQSARAASLFRDDVPLAVYDNLISAVEINLSPIFEYYNLRKKVLGMDSLCLYDLRVPLVKDFKVNHTYEQAVEKIINALSILGNEYCATLKEGLLGGWVDRYENKGKRAGAFSAGSYHGEPYILMNYKEDVLSDVFTLAHEAGHSMHSWYSIKNNPFAHYSYRIFVAEVASTFNEQLLSHYMMQNAKDNDLKIYLICRQIESIIGTIYRQTMFAEYEKITHNMVENNVPLTVESLRSKYQKLLKKYFGPNVHLDEINSIEGLRIPHFYSAFYVYKYATGLSAAIALSKRVLNGGEKELQDYLGFLKAGGSKFPLELLMDAGVDMTTPEPINTALSNFQDLVTELKILL